MVIGVTEEERVEGRADEGVVVLGFGERGYEGFVQGLRVFQEQELQVKTRGFAD